MTEKDTRHSWERPETLKSDRHDFRMTQSEYLTVICTRLTWIVVLLALIAARLYAPLLSKTVP